MKKNKLVIGTRGSLLAVTQTGWVSNQLKVGNPSVEFVTQTLETSGDIAKDLPIGSLNLKGAFTKELDEALLEKRIDIAVHSLKDLPAEIPTGLILGAVTKCIDPRDALLSRSGKGLKNLPSGATVGTSSLRRKALLKKLRPDLQIELLRGNVDTRLRKLDEGKYEAIILAAAGLMRLGYEKRITEHLDPTEFIPAIGQGKLAVVIREKDVKVEEAVRTVDHQENHQIALAERRFMLRMEGGCNIPLGCYGDVRGNQFTMIGFLASQNGDRSVLKKVEGPLKNAIQLADRLADEIKDAFV